MRRSHKEEGGSWMDTYGDMVTLLLCFFVLLYAISAVDQTKWANLVKSFNPDAVKELEEKIKDAPDKQRPEDIKIPEDFETLYENLKKEVEKANLTSEIEVKKGDGFTFITFKSNVVFDGNSYVLKESGKEVLNNFCTILNGYRDEIGQIQILGHTAIASPGKEINITTDRFLSSNRATAVLIYIQEKNIFDPVTLISIGYGQYRPIADNSTAEGRAANRRVELLITKKDSKLRSLDEYYSEVY